MKLQSSTHQQSGIALIIVMIAVVSLTILAGGFAYSMKVETRLAMNSNNDAEMEWLGRSGVELAKYVLGLQSSVPGEPYDSLNQIWAGGPGTMAISNSPLASVSMKDVPLGNGTITIDRIVDLERKININTASENLLEQVLVGVGADAGNHLAIVGSIRDWIDTDNAQHPEGAEEDFYQTMEPPYFPKNGPMDDLSELLLVRGMTPELYWGGEIAERQPSRMGYGSGRELGLQDSPSLGVGLVELFTPLSSGRVNINTAPISVLQVLPLMDERIAAEIVRLRSGPDGADGTEDDIPLRNVGEVVNAGVPPQIVQQLGQYCDVRSRTFEVHIKTQIGSYTREYIAVVGRRDPRNLETLSFRAK